MLPSLPLDKKEVGIDLFSRSVARQVFSAPHSLTFRFGMETKWTLCDKNTNRSAFNANSNLFCLNCSFRHDRFVSPSTLYSFFCGFRG